LSRSAEAVVASSDDSPAEIRSTEGVDLAQDGSKEAGWPTKLVAAAVDEFPREEGRSAKQDASQGQARSENTSMVGRFLELLRTIREDFYHLT
jgi:hypothetical protein